MSEKEKLKEIAKKEAATSSDFKVLIERARTDPAFAAELMVDADEVIRREGYAIDGESKEYQQLRLRLYHAKALLDRTIDDFGGPDFGDFGGIGGTRSGYESLVQPTDFVSDPVNIEKLKGEILSELRSEIKKKPSK